MKKTQIGWVIITVIILAECFVIFTIKDSFGIFIISIVSFIIILLFHNLSIIVSEEFVRFSFGIGLINGKYKLEDIVNCKPVSYFPLGWGIRFRPGIVLYNVSGTKAIELKIRNKKRKVWIGTDSPDELAKFINSKIN